VREYELGDKGSGLAGDGCGEWFDTGVDSEGEKEDEEEKEEEEGCGGVNEGL
jgi:hypothetical protein